MAELDLAGFGALGEADSHGGGAGFKRFGRLIEGEDDGVIAAFGGCDGVLDRDSGFAAASGAHEEGAGAAMGPAAEECVEGGDAALNLRAGEGLGVFIGDEAGKDLDAAGSDAEIMVSAAVGGAAKFGHAKAASFRAVFGGELFEGDDAVGDGVELFVGTFSGAVVKKQDGALAADEELLESENLAAIAEGVLGEEAHFGEGVENDAPGFDAFNGIEDGFGGFAEFDFGGVVHGEL